MSLNHGVPDGGVLTHRNERRGAWSNEPLGIETATCPIITTKRQKGARWGGPRLDATAIDEISMVVQPHGEQSSGESHNHFIFGGIGRILRHCLPTASGKLANLFVGNSPMVVTGGSARLGFCWRQARQKQSACLRELPIPPKREE